MSGSNQIGKILGASTAVGAGVGLLPTTSGSFPLSAVAIVSILTGAVVLTSFAVTKIYARFIK